MHHLALLLAQQPDLPDATGVFVWGGGAMLAIAILTVFATAFWLWMLIDALVNERTTEQKLLWFLVIFFLSFLGALIYFAVRKVGRARAVP